MKYILGFLWFMLIALILLVFYADIWGNGRCEEASGHWISMDGGKHCVDSSFKEIDIYK